MSPLGRPNAYQRSSADERSPLLSRFAPHERLVTLGQIFVRRCQWWQIAPAGRITDEQWHRYSPEFCTGLALKYCEAA